MTDSGRRTVDDGERTTGGPPEQHQTGLDGMRKVATPEQVDVWAGLDVGKEEHFAEVLDDAGERLFARSAA